jgi:hypothetical protein
MNTIGFHPYNNIAPPPIVPIISKWQTKPINIPASIKTRDQLRIYVKQLYGTNIIEMEGLLKYINCHYTVWKHLYPSDKYISDPAAIKELKILGQQCHILKNDYKDFLS